MGGGPRAGGCRVCCLHATLLLACRFALPTQRTFPHRPPTPHPPPPKHKTPPPNSSRSFCPPTFNTHVAAVSNRATLRRSLPCCSSPLRLLLLARIQPLSPPPPTTPPPPPPPAAAVPSRVELAEPPPASNAGDARWVALVTSG